MDDKTKSFLNKIRTEKKKKIESISKIKELEIELVEIKHSNNSNKITKCFKRVN